MANSGDMRYGCRTEAARWQSCDAKGPARANCSGRHFLSSVSFGAFQMTKSHGAILIMLCMIRRMNAMDGIHKGTRHEGERDC